LDHQLTHKEEIVKKAIILDFSDLFKFAEEHYGIGWNPCNDLFFNCNLDYGKHTSVDVGGWVEYVSFEEVKDKVSEYTKEEVLAMNDYDKAYVITAIYLESLEIEDGEDILIDCS